ncbi:MAG TPA: glycosyltransferase [Acidimicrobiales bacterium]|nr:glycosyltransferase [Acidimicrobiales bacterium]
MATSALAPRAREERGAAVGSPTTCFPLAVLEVHLEAGLRSLLPGRSSAGDGVARQARTALVLVRLHGHPLGVVALDLAAPEPPRSWSEAVSSALGPAIDAHLRADGLVPVRPLELWRPAPCPRPRCLAARREALARARPASVVVATRERPRQLERCLDSLLALDYPEFEIIVVDNDPESDDTRVACERRFAGVATARYVRERRRGLGAAHNRALSEAQGDVVAFTDDDVVVDRSWLSALVEPFVTDPAVGAATGLILPAELETPTQWLLEAHGRFAKGFAPFVVDRATRRPADPLFPFSAGRLGSGASMAFDARLLRDIGGFDPALGTGTPAMGGDDLAALFSVLQTGAALAYQPAAIAWHRHHREPAALARQAYGYGVGLGAYVTSVALKDARVAAALAGRLPQALVHTFRHSGAAAIAEGDLARLVPGAPAWPAALSRLERRGILAGPAAYLRSRHRLRRAGDTR